jgi:hypothetical protein
MPQTSNIDKAFDVVRTGPVLPVEVASKLGVDSFLANAYLSQLVEAGKIRQSTERVGNSFVYFLAGQEAQASSRVSNLLQGGKKTARMYASSVPAGPEVEQKRQAFTQRLAEIEAKEQIRKPAPQQPLLQIAQQKPQAVSETQKQEFLNTLKPAIESQLKQQIQPQVAPAQLNLPKIPSPQEVFAAVGQKIKSTIFMEDGRVVEKALGFLIDAGAEIIGKELRKKGREADILAIVPTPIGPIKFFVMARDKRTVSEAELSLAFTAGQHKKLPVIYVTNGKLTKSAQNYHQAISGLVKIKNV